MLLGPVALYPTSCTSYRSWCCINLSKRLHSAGVTWGISRSYSSIAFWRSASDWVVVACQALFRRTWNCLCFVEESLSAPYRRASIAARILWIYGWLNCWDSVANWSSTLAFADFDIICCRNIAFFWWNRCSAASSSLSDRSESFCWPTSRDYSHNALTAPSTISSEAVSAAVYLSSLE